MHVVAINRFYSPDESATSQMLADLAESLVAHGVAVTVVTSRRSYEVTRRLPARETIRGVEVRRVWTTGFGRHGLAGRMIDYVTFYIASFLALLSTVRRGDIVLAKTDPPLVSVSAWIVCAIRRARLVNWCQDLFPEVASALGMKWLGGGAGRLLIGLRNKSLSAAALNAVLNAPMRDRLIAEGVPAERIRILSNWGDNAIRPVPPHENPLRREWGVEERCVIGYSGNLGRAHLPDHIADLIARTGDIPALQWLFIGGGKGLGRIRALAEQRGEHAIAFRPYQPRAALSRSLSVPDIHLISLDPACEGLIMPSKFYGILAVGRPIVFLGAEDGAVATEVTRYGLGIVLPSDRPEIWRDRLATFAERLQERRGQYTDACLARHRECLEETALMHWRNAIAEVAGAPAIERHRIAA
ncbi:glycosyltransferase family 4 protein [Acuticoccus kandeliae]|uniref:glycosyltransferase family 4 protein n=1 Tax=Acuticoccus kandeliae TaxID=2073160 RepID=UPI000D3EB4C3|nr:glycosyltransferase family 4 protein [Acuticoccus kandeliae]